MIDWDEEIKKTLGSCGQNVFIGHNVMFIQPENVFLGDNVRIDPFTLVTSKLKTGNFIHITAYSMLGGSGCSVILGNWCFIGYGSKLFTQSEDYSGDHGPVNEYWGNNQGTEGDIVFNNYAGVASDVTVFPGVNLPEGTCIGTKSLVHSANYKNDLEETTPMEEFCVYYRNPLKLLKRRNKDVIIEKAHDPSFLKER